MGYCYCISNCCACGRMITFNPNKVPSIRVGGVGAKQPICESCFNRWNQIHRLSRGLPPEPLLDGAYQPLDESELP